MSYIAGSNQCVCASAGFDVIAYCVSLAGFDQVTKQCAGIARSVILQCFFSEREEIQDVLVTFHAPEAFRNNLLQQLAETVIALQVLSGDVVVSRCRAHTGDF